MHSGGLQARIAIGHPADVQRYEYRMIVVETLEIVVGQLHFGQPSTFII